MILAASAGARESIICQSLRSRMQSQAEAAESQSNCQFSRLLRAIASGAFALASLSSSHSKVKNFHGASMSADDFELTPVPDKDDRFTKFRTWIFRAYLYYWQCEPRWGGMEARNLMTFLQENPKVTEQEFCFGLKNLCTSSDVPQRQRPGYWLPKFDAYLNHSHDRFGVNPDAEIKTARSENQRRTAEAFERVRARENRLLAGEDGARLSVEGQPVGRRDRRLAQGLRSISGGGD